MTGYAAIDFNAAEHTYLLPPPDGRVVPSVTQILKATGVSLNFDELAGLSAHIGLAIERKRAIGVALHADSHAFDDDDLVWSSVHPDVLPYVEAWATFRGNHPHLRPVTRERRIFHPGLFYAGTLDGVFYDGEREINVLPDIKIGDPEDAGARYQTAGYALACPLPVSERWSVQLTPRLRVPYRITVYSDWRDFDVWRAIVTTYYAQAARRKQAA